jgi:signal transduction histidine kinase
MINERIYNSIILSNYLRMFRSKYPHVDIDDMLDYAGIDPREVDDPFCWFTPAQHNRFHERLSKYFNDPLSICRQAGRFAYSDLALNLFKKFSLRIFGIGVVYKYIGKYTPSLTKSSIYRSRKISSNKYEVTVTRKDGVVESEYIEQNRRGFLEGAPLLFCDKTAKIEAFENGPEIKYILSWDLPTSDLLFYIKYILLGIGIVAGAIAYYHHQYRPALSVVAAAVVAFMLASYFQLRFKYREISTLYNIRERSAESLINSIIEDFDSLKYINEIGEIIIRHNKLDTILSKTADLLSKLHYPRVAFFISDSAHKIRLRFNNGFQSGLDHIRSSVHKSNQINPMCKPKVVTQMESKSLPLGLHRLLTSEFPVIYVPIVYDQSIIGFMLISPLRRTLPIDSRKIKFFQSIASQIALAIQKASSFDHLLESDKLKSAFITTASHELKTPIQALLLGLDDLEYSNDITESLPLLRTGVERLAAVVDNILDLNLIESDNRRLEKQTTRIRRVIASLKEEMLNYASIYSHNVSFEVINDFQFSCDMNYFQTCLLNLFINSCKYTPKHGQIVIRAQSDVGENSVDVIDNGAGIPKWAQEKVFFKFFQADNIDSGKIGGCGLGLSIAKEIIQLHGGEITLASPLESNEYIDMKLNTHDRLGSKFTIHLPR